MTFRKFKVRICHSETEVLLSFSVASWRQVRWEELGVEQGGGVRRTREPRGAETPGLWTVPKPLTPWCWSGSCATCHLNFFFTILLNFTKSSFHFIFSVLRGKLCFREEELKSGWVPCPNPIPSKHRAEIQREGFSVLLSLHLRCPRKGSACGLLQHPIFWLISLTAEPPSTILAGPREVWGVSTVIPMGPHVHSAGRTHCAFSNDGSWRWALWAVSPVTHSWEPRVHILLS